MAAHEHKIVPWWHYAVNFAALTVLMFLTVWVAQFDLGTWNLPLAMTIAIAKATLIVLIFMDVRNGTKLVWIFAAAGFLWLLIMLGFTIVDFTADALGTPYVEPLPVRSQS